MRVLTVILLLFAPFLSTAQTYGYWERYDSLSDHKNWDFPSAVYQKTGRKNVLEIKYNKTITSPEWSTFFITLPECINVSSLPFMSFKIKSSIPFQLGLKPVGEKGQEEWLEKSISGSNEWQSVFFELKEVSDQPIKRVYFYFNGGIQAPQQDIIQIKAFRLGTTPSFENKLQTLQQAISDAEKLILYTKQSYFPEQEIASLEKISQEAATFQETIISISHSRAIEKMTTLLEQGYAQLEAAEYFPYSYPIDPRLSGSTKHLYHQLQQLKKKGFLYGMHDAVGYGVGWSGEEMRSDVKDVCGSYPALFSWDIQCLKYKSNRDRIFSSIKEIHTKGGINTLVWHFRAPGETSFYGKEMESPENLVNTLLPGGQHHHFYKQKLKAIAQFAKSLKDNNGRSIPILFRPFHEHNGHWFWWGKNYTSEHAFVQLWQFTVDYLRNELKVHNFLYVFSPDGRQINMFSPYEYGYPGDQYVDVFGLDFYFEKGTPGEINRFIHLLEKITTLADKKGKIAAVTEVGDRKGDSGTKRLEIEKWHTRVLLEPIKNNHLASRIAYLATWRNANVNHHFAPYPGHRSVPDFISFFKDEATIFLNDLDWEQPPSYPHPAEISRSGYKHLTDSSDKLPLQVRRSKEKELTDCHISEKNYKPF